jgi:hypothetical protein|tara:strand:- start:769 stop:1017 length:249 start_codon:yes stop_codon:yes gene_type:complete
MAKKIAEAQALDVPAAVKQVEIKHLRSMKDEEGKDVSVVDFTEVKDVDDAISEAEARKARLEAQVVEVDAELADYIAIRDAE